MNERDERQPADHLEKARQALCAVPVPVGPPRSVRASTVEALQKLDVSPESFRLRRRRKLMFRIAGFSSLAAAVTLAAIVGGSLWFAGGETAYAFADVIEKIQKAESVVFNNRQRIGDQKEMDFIWYMQGDRIRMELPGLLVLIGDLKQRRSLQLDLTRKTARPHELHKDAARGFMNPVQQLRQLTPKDAKRTGREKLNGRDVDVYRVEKIDLFGAKGKGEMKIWVNPETMLPVRIELKMHTRLGAKPTDPFDTFFTLENFSWNERLDASLFDLEVPKGFRIEKEQVK
jgi:outer membrane lipoprotein-sorting protein